MTSFMGDPYVLVGTVMAILAGAILMTRRPKNDAHQKKLNDEMLKIGEQMKMYKQATAATATATATATAMSLQTSIDGGSFSSNKKTIDDDLDLNIFPGGRILILFGSQTGTAEGFAQTLAKEGRTHGFSTFSKDLEKFNHEKELFLSNDIKKELKVPLRVIFIMATYGEGDPTDNAISFVNFLKNKNFFLETKKSFNHIFFTVFGLGNRQYEHFNATGRFVDQQFEKFGGKRMYPYGEGDDDGCIEEDFDEWKENLWKQLQIKFQISLKEKQKNNEQKSLEEECSTNFILTTTYVIKKIKTPKKISRSMEEEEEEEEEQQQQQQQTLSTTIISEKEMKNSTKHFFTAEYAKVIINRPLCLSTSTSSSTSLSTSSSSSTCTSNTNTTIHLEIDLKNTKIKYQTADNLAILPENSFENVQRFAFCMKYDLNQWVKIETNTKNGEIPFPTPCTIGTILTKYLDIHSSPRKASLRQLAFFTKKKRSRIFITTLFKRKRIFNKKKTNIYHEWILKKKKTWIDIMEHFDLNQIPFEYLFEWIPFLLPRYYTISSSNLVHPQRIHITVSVIKYPITHGNLLFEGVCSSYLERLQPPTNFLEQKLIKKITRPNRPGEQGNKQPRSWPKVCMFVRPSTFRLPSNPSTPIIMIGPGTGIAPMRAFLQERAFQKYQKGIKIGKNILFFGCRYEKQDFLYQEELVKYQKEGVLNELYVAFSRENKKQKIYVQHLLEKQSESIWKLLFEEKAHIYVCGGTNMGNDVHAVLLKIVKQYYHPISHHHDLDGENATTTTTTTTTTTREEEANQYLKSLQTSHRYVQELWA